MISKPKNLIAFSLTEVLITMFILMLIVIAAGPVVTKKVIKKPKPHGVWECKLVNGVHVATISLDGGTPSGAGSSEEHCLFEPQPSAENYTVTVVGGGGGGASGATAVQDAASYGEAVGYNVEADGLYDVLVVGGGGGGSARYKGLGNLGGSAGEIYAQEESLSKGYYILDAGMGGKAGGNADGDTGDDGASAADKCVALPGTSSPSWKDVCDGGDGEPSKFYKVGGGTNIEVRGGYGGKKNTSTSQADNDTNGCVCRKAIGSSGGKIINGCSNSAWNCKKTREIVGNSSQMYGHGGNGTTTDMAFPGFAGIVLLRSATFYAGGGGHQGSVAYMNIKKFKNKEPIKVTVGRGGAGATVENTNGEQGENSSFGNFITAKGGQGGEIKAKSDSNKENGLSGESGYESPYGGTLSGGSASCDALNGTNDMDTDDGYVNAGSTTYGAGGGGGGAFSHKSDCGKWGKGGRGMPGYVRVEWN